MARAMRSAPEAVNWPCVPNNMSAEVPTASRIAFTMRADRSMSTSRGWWPSKAV